ncbi:Facilitated trehalose transporter Tret1 [Orchesella cincta]|uniref:Facilitated trehalose transporter Tret1 n=1 Tax=Orchesella cincta TaxID=48709 RepID=A0A1D2MLY8_ORCCI|nr:Facilitated trehalose transporter Tret1 [Orchesella cincta]
MKKGKYTVNNGDMEMGPACCGSNSHRMPQYLAAATVTIGGFSLGNVLGWSSPAIPNLANSGDFPDIQNYQKAWIGSLVTIGALVGACCSGYLIEKIGRKKSLLVVGIPYIIGWFTIALAHQIYMLYVGRFLTGFSVGALSLVAPVYLCEISQSDIRGFLGAIFQVTVTVGILFTFILGSVTSWKLLAATCGIFPLIFTIFSSFLPESPRYLIAKGRSEEALKALSWLRGSDLTNPSKEVLEEIDENASYGQFLGESAHWIPLASVMAFNAAYCGGVGCLIWTVMSEILPNHVIGFASGLATTFNWTLAFITTRFFQDLNDSLGIHNTFWLFAGACGAAVLFIYGFVPETKGKTLDMIQKENFQQNGTRSVEDIASVASSTADLV